MIASLRGPKCLQEDWEAYGPFLNPGFPDLLFQSLARVGIIPQVFPAPFVATRRPWLQPTHGCSRLLMRC